MHRWVAPALVLLAAAGCGGASPARTTRTTAPRRTVGVAFDGTTTQGQPLRLLRLPTGVEVKMRLNLACRDGSSIRGATIDNRGRPMAPKPDGSFYVQETGRTPPSTFRGYGTGGYRWAVGGTLAADAAHGTVAFRIQFRDTKCKAVKVRWTARRTAR